MVLKDLDEALRDGDTIRAVIRGSGTNQDGERFKVAHISDLIRTDLVKEKHLA